MCPKVVFSFSTLPCRSILYNNNNIIWINNQTKISRVEYGLTAVNFFIDQSYNRTVVERPRIREMLCRYWIYEDTKEELKEGRKVAISKGGQGQNGQQYHTQRMNV